jgi:type II secretory pathway pseudopilin PulG
MSTATIIMVVLICVGSALGIAGLTVAGYRAWRLMKTARAAGISSRAHLQQVMGRAARLAPRLRSLEAKQKAVAEGLERLSTTARKTR